MNTVPKLPGARALAFASRWFDPATVHRTFVPLIADWQHEWRQTATRLRPLVVLRGGVAFAAACVALTPKTLLLTTATPVVTWRVMGLMTRFVAFVSLLMLVPFFTDWPAVPAGSRVWLMMLLLPSMLVVAFPFAIVLAVDGIRKRAIPSRRERIAAARLACVACLITVVFGGWVVPFTNQQFRIDSFRASMSEHVRYIPPGRGLRELTTWELLTNPSLAVANQAHAGLAAYGHQVSKEIQIRVAIPLLPFILVWLRWRALVHTNHATIPAGLSAFALLLVFNAICYSAWGVALGFEAPGLTIWAALVVLIAWGLTSTSRRWLLSRTVA